MNFLLARLADLIDGVMSLTADVGDTVFGSIGGFFWNAFDWTHRSSRRVVMFLARLAHHHWRVLCSFAFGIVGSKLGTVLSARELGPSASTAEHFVRSLYGCLFLAIILLAIILVGKVSVAVYWWARNEVVLVRTTWREAGGVRGVPDDDGWPPPPPPCPPPTGAAISPDEERWCRLVESRSRGHREAQRIVDELAELERQRLVNAAYPEVVVSLSPRCPHCHGTGLFVSQLEAKGPPEPPPNRLLSEGAFFMTDEPVRRRVVNPNRTGDTPPDRHPTEEI